MCNESTNRAFPLGLRKNTENFDQVAGFEVLTVLNMKSTIFWDVTPCSPVEVHRLSEGHTASTVRVEE
jgi:hypothetical protein